MPDVPQNIHTGHKTITYYIIFKYLSHTDELANYIMHHAYLLGTILLRYPNYKKLLKINYKNHSLTYTFLNLVNKFGKHVVLLNLDFESSESAHVSSFVSVFFHYINELFMLIVKM